MEIKSFDGQYRFLSNFFHSPFIYSGRQWNTVEHAFQAMKTINMKEQEDIRLKATPGEAKKAGRTVKLRSDWETVKDNIMFALVKEKFSQNQLLRQELLNTKDSYLEEGNWWHDRYWGVCYCKSHEGVGKNKLGKILMEVREEIK